MVTDLTIENFKSIKHLELKSRKVNIFIGEPNAGKSNIIEALSLFSLLHKLSLKEIARFNNLTELFYDNDIFNSINIKTGYEDLRVKFDNNDNLNAPGSFIFSFNEEDRIISFDILGGGKGESGKIESKFSDIRNYRYNGEIQVNNPVPGRLSSPYGNNLVAVLNSNPDFKKLVSEMFRSKGFRLNIKPVERELMISKEKDDEIYSYSYSNVSETLRRIIFLMACIETNHNTTLLFDEPEAHTFPFYTQYFAERIAYDETNQYFLTTHNPYLVKAIIAKSKPEDVNLIITYMKDYETKIYVLKEEEVLELMDMDIFFNLKRYID